MNPTTYEDLHREVSADIDAEIDSALLGLGPAADEVRAAIRRLLHHQKFAYPLSVLPMLVHGVETGATAPACPLAAVHLLWWTSACYLDDLADGHGTSPAAGLDPAEAVLAAVIGGNALPVRIVRAQQLPEAVRGALIAELMNGWITAVEGQLADMRGDVGRATRNSVLTAYTSKSGGPYAMITAMASILAGNSARRTELWRDFGDVFGVLWQIFNDQWDITTGRNEDLRNGTVTYLLASVLEDAPPRLRRHIPELAEAAADSAAARSELLALLLAPAALDRYREDIGTHRARAHRILDELGGNGRYSAALRRLVDLSAQMILTPGAHSAGVRAG
ncbi:polyprenyl synthetase family protein [Streptomyces sp. NPDC089799]|uniref:polyprenyl synthetase family protein n=1 Tax=Streptomyces sp. NPDC089799 TaxID=3155066 RepID=UPI0034394D8E